MPPLFPLGRILMTTNLQGRLKESNPEHWEKELKGVMDRPAEGDWGDEDEDFGLTDALSCRPDQELTPMSLRLRQ